jgi:cation transport protein ChaC
MTPLWVFGYGSLIWNPGFAHGRAPRALLDGYRRSFCMRSIHHRGTPDAPGLVLALDRAAGCCAGLAFEIAPQIAEETLEYLRARELVSAAYVERWEIVALEDGSHVQALTYVIDPDHAQYCGGLPLEEQAQIIARATGGRGPNAEYLFQTADLLRALDLADAELDWLAARVRSLSGAAPTQMCVGKTGLGD